MPGPEIIKESFPTQSFAEFNAESRRENPGKFTTGHGNAVFIHE